MAAAPLAGNKIHSLPVQVSYHLPSSAQTFTSLFPTPQQVYVHAAPGRSDVDKNDEAWGAIYLKTVVQGIITSSPELHPAHPCSPDHSLYVLDPRETFLRRTRSVTSTAEVWTGKGLVSWALDEPGVGKSLITGRLVRRPEFVTVSTVAHGLNALEALVAANEQANADGAAWGIELCVGLKPGTNGMAFPGPLHVTVEDGSAAGVPIYPQGLPLPVHRPAQVSSTAAPHSDSSSYMPSHQDKPKLPRGRPLGKKKKAAAAAAEREKLQRIDQNVPILPASTPAAHRQSTPIRSDDSMGIPAEIYAKPETMTKDQAQRLLESPAFLNMLEQLTGAPIKSATEKARQEAEAKRQAEIQRQSEAQRQAETKKRASPSQEESEDAPAAKRRYLPRPNAPGAAPVVTKCYNCGTTKSSVWRTKKVEEKMERVCNACGLYYNKTKMMRPPTLWSSVPRNKGQASQKGENATRTDQSSPGFKRTLTQVADSDARRIASNNAKQASARQTRNSVRAAPAPKAGPMTSPPRAHATGRTVRNSKFAASTTVAASSPGGWVQPASDAPKSTPVPAPQESPSTAIRRVIAENARNLAMPLSDDGEGRAATGAWNPEVSAFFDVDGFSMKPGSGSGSAPQKAFGHLQSPPRRHSEADVSSVVKARPVSERSASSEDDVFSQLFQRTSSMGDFASSPAPFDFSQLPPSSPPSLPSNLPHSALLLSSPSGSPMDPSPRPESECSNKVSPPMSGLRHSVTATPPPEDSKEPVKEAQTPGQSFHDILSKLTEGNVSNADELLALFNNFPAASA